MKEFQKYLDSIDNPTHRQRMEQLLMHVSEKYPKLKREIRWGQPMFSDHGTFIIAFSTYKQHIAVAPEAVVLNRFDEDIKRRDTGGQRKHLASNGQMKLTLI